MDLSVRIFQLLLTRRDTIFLEIWKALTTKLGFGELSFGPIAIPGQCGTDRGGDLSVRTTETQPVGPPFSLR